jgi:hypothetical protein
MLCDYGCGKEAKYQFKNGKWCCEDHYLKCPVYRNKRTGSNNPFYGKTHSLEYKKILKLKMKGKRNPRYGLILDDNLKEKISNSLKGKMIAEKNPFFNKKHSNKSKKKMSKSLKYKIKDIKEKWPFFAQVEEMRYNPNKPDEKEIQVHCKNHNCPNSKEKGGWFTPTYIQLYERKRALETPFGMIENNFYCSDKCKLECPLYKIKSDPLKKTENPYTEQEYQQFREFVLERDDYKCQYCGEQAEHVHHERPQKLEPFFSLDPDLAWSVCKKCHYEKGHVDECSTGNLAYKICL